MQVSFLTFGGRKIGTGHLFRCLAMSEWVEKLTLNTEISFHLYDFGAEKQDKALEILHSRSSHCCYIQNKETIKDMHFDTVIVDLLNAPLDLMGILKNRSNLLVSIDNISKSRELSNIAINPLYYKINKSNIGHDYIGPKFQIISPGFLNKQSRWKNKVEKILIIQGGSDPFGITPKIVQDLESLLLNKLITLHVVVGPASNQSQGLLNLANKYHDQIVLHQNILKMSDFLGDVDLAICSVGVVAFEVASMGIPAIHITGVEKELETGVSMSDLGVSINMGMYSRPSPRLYDAALALINNNSSRKNMRDNCLKIFNPTNAKKMIELIIFNSKGDRDDKHKIIQ